MMPGRMRKGCMRQVKVKERRRVVDQWKESKWPLRMRSPIGLGARRGRGDVVGAGAAASSNAGMVPRRRFGDGGLTTGGPATISAGCTARGGDAAGFSATGDAPARPKVPPSESRRRTFAPRSCCGGLKAGARRLPVMLARRAWRAAGGSASSSITIECETGWRCVG
jgi:hypothetical protein